MHSVLWGQCQSGELGVTWELGDKARQSLTGAPFSLISCPGPHFLWMGRQCLPTPSGQPRGTDHGCRPPLAQTALGAQAIPPGSGVPSSLSFLVPLVSAGALGGGETTGRRQKQQWSENLIREGPPEGRESCDVTDWNQASQGRVCSQPHTWLEGAACPCACARAPGVPRLLTHMHLNSVSNGCSGPPCHLPGSDGG